MILANLTLKDWKKIHKLIGKKDQLKAAIAGIDRELGSFESGKPPRRPQPNAKKARRVVHGSRTDRIITALKSAGPQGIRIKDLAKKLKTTEGNVRNWFFTTAKKVKGIAKAGPGRYRWA
jgi:hypothetical protein